MINDIWKEGRIILENIKVTINRDCKPTKFYVSLEIPSHLQNSPIDSIIKLLTVKNSSGEANKIYSMRMDIFLKYLMENEYDEEFEYIKKVVTTPTVRYFNIFEVPEFMYRYFELQYNLQGE